MLQRVAMVTPYIENTGSGQNPDAYILVNVSLGLERAVAWRQLPSPIG